MRENDQNLSLEKCYRRQQRQLYVSKQDELYEMVDRMEQKFCEVVPYDENYYDYFWQLHKDNFKGYFENHYGKWNDARQGKSFAKMLSSGNYQMIVHNDQVVGLLNLQAPEEKESPYGGTYRTSAILRYLCIDKEARGLGIGTAIIRKILKQIDIWSVTLKVYKDNPLALNLYSKLNFYIQPEECDEHYITMKYARYNRNINVWKYSDLKYREQNGLPCPE